MEKREQEMTAARGAGAKKVPARNIANVRSDREKFLRALFVLLLLLGAAGIAFFGFFGARRFLFSGNDRFRLREIEVRSGGYWQDKAPQLAARIGVHPGENLFRIDPGELRRRLLAIPGIEESEVQRILPDTLHLRVIERVPRAVLGNPRSEWVVDETGAVIPRLESMSASVPLPVILGISTSGVKAGMVLETLRPALELIMLTVRSFPDISIIAVNVRNPERLEFFMRFRGQKSCKVILPVRHQNFTYLLSALQSAIIYAERQGDTRGTFDLSFGRNVIIR